MIENLSTGTVLIIFVIITGLTAPIHWLYLKDRTSLISKGFLWKSTLVFIFCNAIILPFFLINIWLFIVIAAIVYGFMIVLFYLSILINRKNSGGKRTII